jgi:large subunit ribosomal protein L13
VLRGKHNPAFSPHLDAGDFVIVVNAKNVRLTGKLSDKQYYRPRVPGRHPGGAQEVLDRHPTRVIREAVEGMLPKNRLGRRLAPSSRPGARPSPPGAEALPLA